MFVCEYRCDFSFRTVISDIVLCFAAVDTGRNRLLRMEQESGQFGNGHFNPILWTERFSSHGRLRPSRLWNSGQAWSRNGPGWWCALKQMGCLIPVKLILAKVARLGRRKPCDKEPCTIERTVISRACIFSRHNGRIFRATLWWAHGKKLFIFPEPYDLN